MNEQEPSQDTGALPVFGAQWKAGHQAHSQAALLGNLSPKARAAVPLHSPPPSPPSAPPDSLSICIFSMRPLRSFPGTPSLADSQ